MAAKKKTASKVKGKAPAKKAPAARKAPAKRGAVKRATAKRASTSAKKTTASVSVGKKPFSKSEMISKIVEMTGIARKEVVAVLESIPSIVAAHVHKNGPEVFSWPGMFKIQVVKKPATKSRQGVNPFTGETMMFKAKPASRRVKIRALKQLKAMAA